MFLVQQVVGQTFQNLENASPRTYIGSGKTFEVEGAVDELEADTVIFDDELTPGTAQSKPVSDSTSSSTSC